MRTDTSHALPHLCLALTGLVLGLAGAWASARLLANQLYEIKPYDPVTFIVVGLTLVGVAFLACWLPARRATQINPVEALRHE